jgi:hypothetical protein
VTSKSVAGSNTVTLKSYVEKGTTKTTATSENPPLLVVVGVLMFEKIMFIGFQQTMLKGMHHHHHHHHLSYLRTIA